MNYPLNSEPSRHHANRRRTNKDFSGESSSILPVICVATLAAIVAHALLFLSIPVLLHYNIIRPVEATKVVDDVIRVVVAPSEIEMEVVKTDGAVPEELEMTHEEVEYAEIDIIDLEMEELSIAPGETNIPEPEAPETLPNEELSMESIAPLGTDTFELPEELPTEAIDLMPEPTPINANDVIANTIASEQGVDDASELLKSELIEQAGQTDGLPEDTRSLGELIKMRNLGASSGVARLGADLLFAFGKNEMRNSARVTMLQLAALVLKNPKTKFIVEGHTDSFGSSYINNLLSLQRAAAVREWLHDNRIPTGNIYLRACGTNNPLVSTDGDADAQRLNRRVEIHMRSGSEPLPMGAVPDTYKVDVKTAVTVQLSKGVLVPAAYPPPPPDASKSAKKKGKR